ncbi:MAG: (d)CMP kinase [Clostridiales bacterium]|nr:(d)CMP kinase [Clostridiales bacterium]
MLYNKGIGTLEETVLLKPDLTGDKPPGEKREKILTIAIDGPAGAGKSTISMIISKALNIIYLDTGAMYRAVALKMISKGIDLDDRAGVISALEFTDIQIKYDDDVQRLLLDGEDVTSWLRAPKISEAASKVAEIPEVRIKLVDIQRQIASENSLIMDGRDIGTYVLPDAPLKFFLTASLEERAERRWKETDTKDIDQDYDSIKRSIMERDYNDENRSFSPLKKSEDATLIDTTGKSIEEVSSIILEYIHRYLERRRGD